MLTQATYRTNMSRAHGAIFVGSLIGGALTAIFLIGAGIWRNGIPDLVPSEWEDFLIPPLMILFVTMIAAIVFYIGLIFLAAPIWLLFHYVGLRDPITACVLGAVLAGLVNASLFRFEAIPWPAMAVIGGAVGYVVWYVAYLWSGRHGWR